MNERKREKRMFAFLIAFIFLCAVCMSTFWIHSCQHIAFEHISAFCEIFIEADPKAERQVLSALKEYHFLTEREVDGNNFISQYGYSVGGFCKGLNLIFRSFRLVFFSYYSVFFSF